LCWSEGDSTLYSCSSDKHITEWNTENGQIKRWEFYGHLIPCACSRLQTGCAVALEETFASLGVCCSNLVDWYIPILHLRNTYIFLMIGLHPPIQLQKTLAFSMFFIFEVNIEHTSVWIWCIILKDQCKPRSISSLYSVIIPVMSQNFCWWLTATWVEVIVRVKWIMFVSLWYYKSGPLKLISRSICPMKPLDDHATLLLSLSLSLLSNIVYGIVVNTFTFQFYSSQQVERWQTWCIMHQTWSKRKYTTLSRKKY